jgi:SAM-dependent methyltransferase
MVQPDVLQGYAADAAELIPKFEGLRTSEILLPVEAFLPTKPSLVLDVGAGTGRDAAWLADRGHVVVAVEPVRELREAGMSLHPTDKIRWVDDRLPALDKLREEPCGYDLILLIAVWQHLPPQMHQQAIAALSDKLSVDGRLIMSVRHGPGSPTRPCYPADADKIISLAERAGLRLRMRCSADSLSRETAIGE